MNALLQALCEAFHNIDLFFLQVFPFYFFLNKLCPHWINKSTFCLLKSGTSHAPKQLPSQITIFAFVLFSSSLWMSAAFGFNPSGSWMQTRFALCCFIAFAAFSSSRL